MNDLLYLKKKICIRKQLCYLDECNTFHHSFVSYIFCSLLFFSCNSLYYIYTLYFICYSACFMTFSLLHVYLQRESTLILHTCTCILMTFYTVCMFYFSHLIITCIFVCILTCTTTCTHCTFNQVLVFSINT